MNAEHISPMVFWKDTILELNCKGITLGFAKDSIYKEETIELESGDLVLFYTDGIHEQVDEKDEPYGMTRLRKCISQNLDKTVRELVDGVMTDVDSFRGSAKQDDDMTLVGVRVL